MANRPLGIGKGVRDPRRTKKADEMERRRLAAAARPVPKSRRPLTDEERDRIGREDVLDLCVMTARTFLRGRKSGPFGFEDLYQQSFLGLAEAFKGFDRRRGVQLGTSSYAARRGSCLDMMRRSYLIRVPDHVAYEEADCPRVVSAERDREGEAALSIPHAGRPPGFEHESEDAYRAWTDGLTDEEKSIVRSYVVDGRSFQSIADEIGCSLTRVNNKYHRAMTLMRLKAVNPRYADLLTA